VCGDGASLLWLHWRMLACAMLLLFERAVSRTRMPEQGAVDVDKARPSGGTSNRGRHHYRDPFGRTTQCDDSRAGIDRARLLVTKLHAGVSEDAHPRACRMRSVGFHLLGADLRVRHSCVGSALQVRTSDHGSQLEPVGSQSIMRPASGRAVAGWSRRGDGRLAGRAPLHRQCG
jgi:hypothetical protein